MSRNRLFILLFVTLMVGAVAGFMLRPVFTPSNQTLVANNLPPPVAAPEAPRGTQYFETNIEEARQVAGACRDGTVRGNECTNAETAIVTVESRDRFKRFRTDQR